MRHILVCLLALVFVAPAAARVAPEPPAPAQVTFTIDRLPDPPPLPWKPAPPPPSPWKPPPGTPPPPRPQNCPEITGPADCL